MLMGVLLSIPSLFGAGVLVGGLCGVLHWARSRAFDYACGHNAAFPLILLWPLLTVALTFTLAWLVEAARRRKARNRERAAIS